ncbi:MAG: isoprenylcysteine carboxylmethyltransferase family protein [Candidatus Acidiferrales bacterium]
MAVNADLLGELAFVMVGVCWLAFGAILVVGKKQASGIEMKRDMKSHIGFALQGVAYAMCYALPRPYFSPFLAVSKPGEIILTGLTIAIAAASVWFCYAAARTLGKQWALVARVVEGHELVMRGPYAVVRNPIYLAMLGMLIASGLASTRWVILVVALVIFQIGTAIRIRSEEKILREAFGVRFDDYARRVPAFLPRIV